MSKKEHTTHALAFDNRVNWANRIVEEDVGVKKRHLEKSREKAIFGTSLSSRSKYNPHRPM